MNQIHFFQKLIRLESMVDSVYYSSKNHLIAAEKYNFEPEQFNMHYLPIYLLREKEISRAKRYKGEVGETNTRVDPIDFRTEELYEKYWNNIKGPFFEILYLCYLLKILGIREQLILNNSGVPTSSIIEQSGLTLRFRKKENGKVSKKEILPDLVIKTGKANHYIELKNTKKLENSIIYEYFGKSIDLKASSLEIVWCPLNENQKGIDDKKLRAENLGLKLSIFDPSNIYLEVKGDTQRASKLMRAIVKDKIVLIE